MDGLGAKEVKRVPAPITKPESFAITVNPSDPLISRSGLGDPGFARQGTPNLATAAPSNRACAPDVLSFPAAGFGFLLWLAA